MPERFKYKYVIFKTGEQQEFMEEVVRATGMTADQLAHKLDVSGRSVRDWRREACKMPLTAVKRLVQISAIPMPTHLRLQDQYAHLRVAGIKGGMAVMAKYGRVGGDEQKRKKAWFSWWQKIGAHQESKILYKRKVINYPVRSVKLAEFVGILMGDGGISTRQVTVTLHSETDREFAVYYSELCESLFGIRPSITKVKNCKAVNVTISRTDLVHWCHKLGLPIGHKIRQGLDIPHWIKQNGKYSRACLRGLIDTDGSIFNHRYRVGGKEYEYKKLDFCTLSPQLLKSAYLIFRANGMNPYVRPGKILRLENQKDVERYFKVIGTSNPKHLRRYRE